QKAREILLLPTACAMIIAKLALAPVKFLGVHAPPAASQSFVRYHRVQHFVIKHVLQKPARHECLIEQGMNPNHAVFLLDRAKNKMVLRPMFAAAAPLHFVITKPAAKVALVQLVENLAEIEMFAFLSKV